MEKLTSQEIQLLVLKLVLEHKHGKDNWNTALVRAIARECAKIAVAIECPIEEGISRQTQGHTWDMACVAAATKIKEHFGVTK